MDALQTFWGVIFTIVVGGLFWIAWKEPGLYRQVRGNCWFYLCAFSSPAVAWSYGRTSAIGDVLKEIKNDPAVAPTLVQSIQSFAPELELSSALLAWGGSLIALGLLLDLTATASKKLRPRLTEPSNTPPSKDT